MLSVSIRHSIPIILYVSDMTRRADHLVFDIMGEVGFAQSFGMVDNGEDHTYVHFVEKAMYALA